MVWDSEREDARFIQALHNALWGAMACQIPSKNILDWIHCGKILWTQNSVGLGNIKIWTIDESTVPSSKGLSHKFANVKFV